MDFSTSSGSEESSELSQAQIELYKHITLLELASALNLHPSKIGVLHRFLRLLTHNGFFVKTTVSRAEGAEETAYGLTPSSKLLVKSKSTCLAPIVKGALHPSSLGMWGSSKKWLTEDKEDLTLFQSATGESFWEFLNKESETLSLFQDAMAADSNMFKLALKECKHVFKGLTSLVDVAGGTGGISKLIHEAFPDIKCTVFDQPQVVANLSRDENMNFVGGDMFISIPPADAVLLKWVLHDWNDEHSMKILKNCKEAISGRGKDGKVIIIEILIDETSDDRELTGLELKYDLVMLSRFNGKEREKKEWEKLIYDAGFSSYKITPICGFKSLIEVFP